MSVRIWAPRARTLDVVVDDERHPLQRDDDGVFHGDPPLPVGARHALSVDGGPAFADPRAQLLPDGVLGAACVVDLDEHQWHDAAFVPRPLSAGLISELHVGTFSAEGTFDGAIAHLDHLVQLGVTHVEMMPVASFPGVQGWGYDGVALFAVHAPYGGPLGLLRFVDACHARGLAVILDVVMNHLGPCGNFLGQLGPYFTDQHRTPWGDALNFDGAGSDEVRRFFIDLARHWLVDFHIDGLRLDAVHAIHDESAVHILEELAGNVRAWSAQVGKELVLIAESDANDPRLVRPLQAHGLGMHAQWSDDFHHALHAWLTGERTGYYADFTEGAQGVARALHEGFIYTGQLAKARGRRHGRSLGDLPGHVLLGYAQTHDQIGNRAQGERLAQLVGPGGARIALALVLTSPFVPMLFQGEEWGASTPFLYFTDHRDEQLAQAVREGRRREFAAFGWDPAEVPDPQATETFARSKLDWSELHEGEHAATLAFVQELVKLRRHPSIASGDRGQVRCTVDPQGQWLLVQRDRVLVAVNRGQKQRVCLAEEWSGARVLVSTHANVDVSSGGLVLEQDAVVILQSRPAS